MYRTKYLAFFLLFLLLPLLACSPRLAKSSVNPPGSIDSESKLKEQSSPVPAQSQAIWEQEWLKALNMAKKEGKVVIYTSAGGEPRTALIERFTSQYGITVEAIAMQGGLLAEKLMSERRAGLELVDIIIAGAATYIPLLTPEGPFTPSESMLILPDVKNPDMWYQKKLLWLDPEHRVLIFFAYPMGPMIINSQLVMPEEISSYHDLLNPKWKGKIVFHKPTIPGVGQQFFGTMGLSVLGADWLRSFAKQEPAVIDDRRQLVEWVAQGKYPIGLAAVTYTVDEFQKAGAPIKWNVPKEGTWLTSGHGSLAVAKGAPHPNATKVYLNWLLGKEGQTIFSKASGQQSARIDVPSDFLNPVTVRSPSAKYFNALSEEYLRRNTDEQYRIARDIFGPLIK